MFLRTGLAMLALLTPALGRAADTVHDATATALDQCLALPANASTAGQTNCEAVALRRYDARLNTAYRALISRLPAGAADRLRASQRAWLAFRNAEAKARGAIYATRQGTMFAPMEAGAAAQLVGDRARLLEGYLRVLRIDG